MENQNSNVKSENSPSDKTQEKQPTFPMEIQVPVIDNPTKPNKIKPKRLAPKKKAMIMALEANLGNITGACEKVGINRWTYYEWMKDPLFKEQVDTIPERIKDFAETALLAQMKAGVPASTIFFLKTKARDRGYIEKVDQNVEVSHKDGILKVEIVEPKGDENGKRET